MLAALRSPAALLFSAAVLVGFVVMVASTRPPIGGRSAVFTLPPQRTAQLPSVPRPDPEKLPSLSASLPFDITAAGSKATSHSLRRDLDVFSWRTFIALNWPALSDGEPDLRQIPGEEGDNPAVWEKWKPSSKIFPPGALVPSPWAASPPPEALPAALRGLPAGPRVLSQTGTTPGVFTEFIHPLGGGPLIDQNGRYTCFETLVNRPMFDAIVAQRLYEQQAQAEHSDAVFPSGTANGAEPGLGSIMVKAAWKILSPGEIAARRFHAVQAVIHTPASATPPTSERIEHATVGLVGLHIVHKTASAPQWIWSTFEHVDNCPTVGEPPYRAAYNFYNKASPGLPENQAPDRPWDPTVVEPPHRRPQIVRQIPIEASTRALNAAYQAALRAVNPSSVWQYYELVGTQGSATAPSERMLADAKSANAPQTPAPPRLANTTASASSDFTHLLRRPR